jgi:hypothetical protein
MAWMDGWMDQRRWEAEVAANGKQELDQNAKHNACGPAARRTKSMLLVGVCFFFVPKKINKCIGFHGVCMLLVS